MSVDCSSGGKLLAIFSVHRFPSEPRLSDSSVDALTRWKNCCCAVDCFGNLDESYTDRFVNNAVGTGHPSRNHRLLDSGHRDIGHDHRLIAFGCRLGIGRHHDGNCHLSADDPMTVDTRYPYYGRIDARHVVSSCFEARSGKLGSLSFG